jgi:D-alanine-D-alanine ligase
MRIDAQPQPAELGRVAVLCGGASAEREISLASGAACLAALQAQGVDAEACDPAEQSLSALSAFDRAFIALHGPGGEDGTMQGALETLGLPYTGSGVLGSALAMDKLRSKWVWQALGLPTPAFRVLQRGDDPATAAQALGLPVFVNCREARAYGEAVLVEQCIEGPEYTVAILNSSTLPAIRIDVDDAFYDFKAKYRSEATRMTIPSGLTGAAQASLNALCERAFAAVSAHGWGRVDVMADANGDFWLLEVNTIPGMTDHSLVPAAALAAGMNFQELVWQILLTSWRHGDRP